MWIYSTHRAHHTCFWAQRGERELSFRALGKMVLWHEAGKVCRSSPLRQTPVLCRVWMTRMSIQTWELKLNFPEHSKSTNRYKYLYTSGLSIYTQSLLTEQQAARWRYCSGHELYSLKGDLVNTKQRLNQFTMAISVNQPTNNYNNEHSHKCYY